MLENLGARITEGDALGDLTKAVGGLGGAFKEVINSGGFDEIIAWAQRGFERLAGIVDQVAENLPDAFEGADWSGLIDSLDDLADTAGDVLGGIFGDIDLTTVDGLQSAIQTTIDTIESLTRTTQGIVEAFRPVGEAIGETVRHFNDLDAQSKIDFGETIGSAKVLVDVGAGLGLALLAIGKAGLEMGSVLDAVFGGSKVLINSLQVAFDTAVLGILKTLQGLAGTFGFDETAAELQLAIDGVWQNALKNSEELKQGWRQAMGEAGTSTDEFRARIEAAEQGLINARDQVSNASDSLSVLNEQASSGQIVWDDLKGEWVAVGEAADDLSQKTGKIESSTKSLALETKGYLTVTETLADGTQVLGYESEKTAKSIEKSADKTKEAAKESDEYRLKIKALDQEMQQAKLEAFVSIKTAQLEADAERVKATFASIDSSIASTGDTVSSLFSTLSGNNLDSAQEAQLESQLRKEQQYREKSFELQERLTNAEIDRITAQTEALARGDGLITIQADGLEPEIEAFMWKILQNIRVRANAEFQDYLLGMGSA
jgi:phage-related protein